VSLKHATSAGTVTLVYDALGRVVWKQAPAVVIVDRDPGVNYDVRTLSTDAGTPDVDAIFSGNPQAENCRLLVRGSKSLSADVLAKALTLAMKTYERVAVEPPLAQPTGNLASIVGFLVLKDPKNITFRNLDLNRVRLIGGSNLMFDGCHFESDGTTPLLVDGGSQQLQVQNCTLKATTMCVLFDETPSASAFFAHNLFDSVNESFEPTFPI
jgi:hypothetical protein